jgi:hypothetical protein
VINLRDWLEIWNRWDSLHYLKLAELASSADPMRRGLTRYFHGRRVFAGTTHYLVAAFVALTFPRGGGSLETGGAIMDRSTAVSLVLSHFPTAYFLHIGYTESFHRVPPPSFPARNERRWMAGLFGALCRMTRPTGLSCCRPSRSSTLLGNETLAWRGSDPLVPLAWYISTDLKIAGNALFLSKL